MKCKQTTNKGFTLLEMLLVMAIIASIIFGIVTYSEQKMMQIREDRAVLQVQQILNAGLAFYLNNTKWPTSVTTDLQGDGTAANPGGYLPGPSTAVNILNPWGHHYKVGSSSSTGAAPNAIFAVCTLINAGTASPAITTILAGRLPMAYVVNGNHTADCTSTGAGIPSASTCTAAPCTLVATVNVPGQNLNNARSVNFAGIYHNGACVPVPTCPGNMTAQVFLAPTSVSGMDNASGTSEVFPLHSFTAYYAGSGPLASPPDCVAGEADPVCANTTPGSNDTFWRACLQVITTNGEIVYTHATAEYTSILAFTRCSPNHEDTVSGSPITVWGPT